MPGELPRLSDEALLALVARSDEAALAELYDRFGAVAYRLALRILRDSTLAEDAVQDGFLTLWRTAGRFRAERASASTWVLTIVHRRAVDLVRREQRRREQPLEEEVPHRVDAVGEEASLRERRRTVQSALAKLPTEHRRALELAYYGGLTQSQVAERLGQPLGTIKSRTFAALGRLGELLREAGCEAPGL